MTKCRYCKKELKEGMTICDSPICQAKRELSEYRYMMKECEELEEDVEELLARIRSCSSHASQCGSSGTRKNSFEDQMNKYLDLKAIYEKKREDTYNQALSVEYKIRELESPFRDILRLKYIKLWTFEKIAVELNYYFRHIQRLYDKALIMYSELKDGIK